MKKVLLSVLCFLSFATAQANNELEQQLRETDPNEIRITLELSKIPGIEQAAWEDIKLTVLQLFNPVIDTQEDLDTWLSIFNNIVKKVALKSQEAKGVNGTINIRFIT